jgi:sec-independent protein translocase protein TatA
MGGLSWWHWLIIGAAFILLFGAKKLPDAARGIGRSLRILKSEVGAMSDDDAKQDDATAPVAPAVVATPAIVAAPAPTAQVPSSEVPVVAVPVR